MNIYSASRQTVSFPKIAIYTPSLFECVAAQAQLRGLCEAHMFYRVRPFLAFLAHTIPDWDFILLVGVGKAPLLNSGLERLRQEKDLRIVEIAFVDEAGESPQGFFDSATDEELSAEEAFTRNQANVYMSFRWKTILERVQGNLQDETGRTS